MRVQSALAIAILTIAPMRIKNLASLRLGRHIVQTRPGGVRHIVIPAEEVKNRTPLAFEVSERARRGDGRLSFALSAAVGGRSGGFPVPRAEGGRRRRRSSSLSRSSAHSGRRRELFSTPTPSAISRPSCSWPSIRANTRPYVRLFLGQKSLNTTVKYYCGLEQADALRRYDALIDRYRKMGDPHDAPVSDRRELARPRPRALEQSRRAGGPIWRRRRRGALVGRDAVQDRLRLQGLAFLARRETAARPEHEASRPGDAERVAAYIAEIQAELAPYYGPLPCPRDL